MATFERRARPDRRSALATTGGGWVLGALAGHVVAGMSRHDLTRRKDADH